MENNNKGECPKCVEQRTLLGTKHGECWECVRTRAQRSWERAESRRVLIAAKKARAKANRQPVKSQD